jgi:hypothetical protein
MNTNSFLMFSFSGVFVLRKLSHDWCPMLEKNNSTYFGFADSLATTIT